MFGPSLEIIRYGRAFLRLIYPAYCASCQMPLGIEEKYLCPACFLKIVEIPSPHCLRCATPLPPFGPHKTLCQNCHSERPYYDRGYALVHYEEPVKTIFHQVKFQSKVWLLEVFSNLVRNSLSSLEMNDYDALVPIPLERSREHKRTFNQAEVVARMLAQNHNQRAPRVFHLLKKKRKTVPQSQLRRSERLRNLEGAFSVRRRSAVKGMRLLLVDDIVTTGATINECARMLKQEGAEQVDFFTIARS